MRSQFILISAILLLLNGIAISVYQPAMWILLVLIPIILLGIYDISAKNSTLFYEIILSLDMPAG